jgi:hypothetical protein
MGYMRNAYTVFTEKLKRSVLRPRRRWENILREILWKDVDWIHLA